MIVKYLRRATNREELVKEEENAVKNKEILIQKETEIESGRKANLKKYDKWKKKSNLI